MSTLYLTEQGAVLKKTSQRLLVEKDGSTLLEIPAFQVDRILIFGNVQVSTQAINFLLERGIDVSFLSTHGKLRGRLTSTESKNVFLRLAQYDRFKDEDFKLSFAKNIIRGKMKNQKTLLYRYQRNHPEVDFSDSIETIDQCLSQVGYKKQMESVLGLEGSATGAYFKSFSRMLRKGLGFEKREHRPSPDPVNALLSFGYVLITNEIDGILESLGFDPFIGFLHGIRYGRRSLALDLVEEFRHPVIDMFTVTLINLGVFKENDFFRTSDGGVRMERDALKRYFEHYEKRLERPFSEQTTDQKVSLRKVFRHQAERLEKLILEGEEYQPFLVQ